VRPVAIAGSEDANLRNGAIEALQQMPDEVAPHVEAMLADPDSDVRIFAVDVLSALPHPMVPEWLRRVVTLDPHVNVCAAAFDALAEAGQPDVIPALGKAGRSFSDVAFIQFAVDAAIRRIRGR
jgi:HEAT repeat protein